MPKYSGLGTQFQAPSWGWGGAAAARKTTTNFGIHMTDFHSPNPDTKLAGCFIFKCLWFYNLVYMHKQLV